MSDSETDCCPVVKKTAVQTPHFDMNKRPSKDVPLSDSEMEDVGAQLPLQTALEVFSGSGNLSVALESEGFATVAMDIKMGPEH